MTSKHKNKNIHQDHKSSEKRKTSKPYNTSTPMVEKRGVMWPAVYFEPGGVFAHNEHGDH